MACRLGMGDEKRWLNFLYTMHTIVLLKNRVDGFRHMMVPVRQVGIHYNIMQKNLYSVWACANKPHFYGYNNN